jgi:hypothetical protein
MLKTIRILCFTSLLIGGGNAFAQLSKSPYTVQGIGDIQGMGLISNESMGGVGISLGRPFFINNINPALLPLNSVTTFEIAALGERRDLSRDTLSQSNTSIDFGYLAFSFPLIRGKSSFSVGLKPYSIVDYSILSRQSINGSTSSANVSLLGTGGINQAYIATGAKLSKNLYLGARAGYFFGSIIDETTIEPFVIQEPDTVVISSFKSNYYRRTSYSDMGLGFGMVYSFTIRKDASFSLGATYDLQTDLSTKRLETLEQKGINDNLTHTDTLSYNENSFVNLPARYGVGISFNNGLKWAAAADLTMQDWSQFRNYKGETDDLKNSYKVAVGLEFIPDLTSVTSYFKRSLYRTGFYYQTTPFSKNNTQIKEIGINFGTGFPISDGSLLNVMFGFGQRGFGGENLIKENIYKVSLGITFNDSGWFYRRKYN